MRIACVLLLLALAPATAGAAAPETISQPRDEITGLFYGEGGPQWTWRDGAATGASQAVTGGEAELRPGFVQRLYTAKGRLTAYSHDGTLTVYRRHTRLVVARGRRDVTDVHLTASYDGRQMLAWTEGGRRLYVSVAPTAKAPFGPPRLLAHGRIRRMDLADVFSGTEGAVVWQNGAGDIRARIREGERRGGGFGPPITIAGDAGELGAFDLDYASVGASASLIWSSPAGTFGASKLGGETAFRTIKLSDAPASGAGIDGRKVAWGTPGAVNFVLFENGRKFVKRSTLAVDGTPHVDDVSTFGKAVYTLDGTVYYQREALGTGHDARVFVHDVVWIDGASVMRATPGTNLPPPVD